MSVTKPILTDRTFKEQTDMTNRLLAAIACQSGGIKASSWADVQQLVRMGLHKQVFAIGDQLACQQGERKLTWEVIGMDHDTPADPQFTHSLTLQLHDCLPTMPFEERRALYYCDSVLPAGTYHFSLAPKYDVNYGGGKTYQFALTQDVPAGGILCFPWGYMTQATSVQISSYATPSAQTALESVAVCEGSEGRDLGTADGESPNMNDSFTIRYGSNNWKESDIRQWLNSEQPAGAVWRPQMKFDKAPAWAQSSAGFLNAMDAEFLSVIGKTRKVTCRSKTAESEADTTEDRFFLLSGSEVFAGREVRGINEGDAYPFYANYSDSVQPSVSADRNRIKYDEGRIKQWLLRTPNAESPFRCRIVDASGAVAQRDATAALSIIPACNVI